MMFVYSEYQREKANARMISTRGHVGYRYCGPSWVAPGLRRQLPWFDRVVSVTLYKNHTHVELYRLQSLPYLEELTLDFPNVTEFRIHVLQSLSKLKTLRLVEMQMTEHKIGSAVLKEFHGVRSQSTPKDRERLRKALLSCTITPDP
ncbi:MAG: hypothetical protein JWP89_2763 [Schlesneria sp.]|nr:hypothetical protein [Schlesneria sp.]